MSKIIVEMTKQLGKAVIAGIGLELAKVAAEHVRKRFGPKKAKEDELKKENAELKEELERMKAGHVVTDESI